MSSSLKEKLIPVLSLLAGIAVTGIVAAALHRSQASAEAVVLQKFDDLEPSQQEEVLRKAAAFKELQQKSPEQFQRLKAIHTAVEADSRLATKLQRLHEWWQTLDSGERNRLKQSGAQFADDWVEEVEAVYFETQNKPNEFAIRLLRGRGMRPEIFRTTETDMEACLRQIIPEDTPPDLAIMLEGLSEADQGCERTLAQLMWLQKRLTSVFGGPGRSPGAAVAETMEQAVIENLLDGESRARLETNRQQFMQQSSRLPKEWMDKRQTMWSAAVSMSVIRAAMDHYYDSFRQKHLGGQRGNLVALFDELDHDIQMELMRKDAKEAEKELERILIKQMHTQNPAIARIAEELRKQEELRRRLPSRLSRSGIWGGRGRGDGRGREGGPPGSGDRGPGDHRPPRDRRDGNGFGGPPGRPKGPRQND